MKVEKVGRIVQSLATHHNHGEGWTYSRNLRGMKHIRYERDWQGYDGLWPRIRRAFDPRLLFARDGLHKQLGMKWSLGMMWAHIRVTLRTDTNLPDGALHSGCIITSWEEDGEYIESMGPTVGAIVADFLQKSPTHPYAEAIAAEIERIWTLSQSRRDAEDPARLNANPKEEQ